MGRISDKINEGGREKAIRRIIFLEGLANFMVLAIKSAVGFTTGSMAIVGDALHSLTDVANNIVAWAIVKQAQKPADKEHPYGHYKFETLAVLGLSALLTVLAFELAINALRHVNVAPEATSWELALMLGVLLVNISLATWQRIWAKKLDSSILHADASHTFADVLTTIVVIVGWQLSAMGYPWLDKLCALGVAGLIFYLAFELFKKSAPILLDRYAVEPEQLTENVLKIEGVDKVGRVRSRWIGNHASVDMVIWVDPNLSTRDSHKICDQVEETIEKEFSIFDISIHVEPNGD